MNGAEKSSGVSIAVIALCFLFGLAITAFGAMLTMEYNESVNGVQTETVSAVITRIEKGSKRYNGKIENHNTAYVSYTYNDREYTAPITVCFSEMKEGKHIEIKLDPENPDKPRTDEEQFANLAVLAMGAVFLCAGIINIIKLVINTKRSKQDINT